MKYCRHIKTSGRRCGCPAVIDKAYCYFHFRSRERHRTSPAPSPAPPSTELILHPMRADSLGQALPVPAAAPAVPFALEFPPLEDHESIGVAVSMVVSALGRGLLDGRRAATILYGLQVASSVTRPDIDPEDSYMVELNPIPTPEGTDISPDEDPIELE